jgi:hypothetical protein
MEVQKGCSNDFRGVRMSKMMESVFEQFLIQLVEQGLVDLNHVFVGNFDC